MDVNGKVALVTGSSSGIGEAIARRLAEQGAKVVVNSRSSVDEGQAVAESLPDAVYVQADIGDPDSTKRLIDQTLDTWGRLDVLVNNAGVTRRIDHADLDAVTPEIWREILNVNVVGTFETTRLAVPALRENGGGCVINITSLAGLRQVGSSIPYSTSKAALNHLTALLAKVVGPEVRVNAIAPGLIHTPWTEDWDEMQAAVEAGAPLRRVGTPDDIADVCAAVIGADYMTGAVLPVEGGLGLVL
ncbi:MAG: SDR family oxidoreductase [Nitriliruptorales bacterium]|nr:SDR family oxidoreductase [Nitriliruptorales bacterium]